MAKEDIMLSMHDDSFFVRASKEGVRYVGSYATCCPIDYEKAKAKYHNGLLVIDVPYKKPQERGIEIPITWVERDRARVIVTLCSLPEVDPPRRG